MYDTLKPCPFCGSPFQLNSGIWWGEGRPTRFQGICSECEAEGDVRDSAEEAISAWNNRPTEDALLAELEKLKEENAKLTARKALTLRFERPGRVFVGVHSVPLEKVSDQLCGHCKGSSKLSAEYLVVGSVPGVKMQARSCAMVACLSSLKNAIRDALKEGETHEA